MLIEKKKEDKKTKVVIVLGSLHRGGAETMTMNYFRKLNKDCIFTFIIHKRFDNDYYDEILDAGHSIIVLDQPGKIGFFKYLRNLTSVLKTFGKIDAIHIQTDHQCFISVIAAKKAKIKNIIVHSHNTYFPFVPTLLNRLTFSLFRVHRLACGEDAGKALYGKAPFEIINNAIDFDFFRNVDANSIKIEKGKYIGKKLVGHIGRFSEAKNHVFILDVARKVIEIDKDVIFLLYGEGPDEKKIKELVLKYNLQDNVLFMGTTSLTNVVYKIIDVFILPSLYEGLPVTLIESQISGCNTLCSSVITKEVDLGLGKINFIDLNVEEWVFAIFDVLKKDKEAFSSSRQSNRLSDYDIDTQSSKLLRYYEGTGNE